MRLASVPFVALCLLGILCGLVAAPDVGFARKDNSGWIVDAPLGDFVKAEGTRLTLSGRPFYFQGSNFYRLGLIERQADNEAYDIMRQFGEKGIKVVRIWGFSCGDYVGKAMLKSATNGELVYDEEALRRLDIALDAARTAQVKIILPLVNRQSEYCSMDWWVKQVTGKDDPQLFYSDPQVQAAFKRHITKLLTRENVIYNEKRDEHIAYANDPTIMAIELANEPHTDDHYEEQRGIPSGELIYRWLSEMSSHVHSLDGNHLIASGEEGYKHAPSTEAEKSRHSWLSDGCKGVDFARNLSLPYITLATVHPYPGNWGIPASDFDWFISSFIADRGAIAHAQGKPIILEETGFSFEKYTELGYADSPGPFIGRIYQAAMQADYAGTMAWQLVPPGTEVGDYIFDFNSPIAVTIFSQVKLWLALSQL